MVLASALGDWWGAVTAPQATLIAAVGLGLVGALTVFQKMRTDRRDQWWKRVQWALDLSLSADEFSQLVGWAALEHLSEEATNGDKKLLLSVLDAHLDFESDEQLASSDAAAGDDTTQAGEDADPPGSSENGRGHA